MRPFLPALVRRGLLRVALALLALVTAAAPAAAAVGEGVLASGAGRSPVAVHVEDGRRKQCPYVHADDCVLCAVVGAHALPATVRFDGAADVGRCRDVPAPVAALRAAASDRGVRNARGPPTG